MTTNITPMQALEQIKELCNSWEFKMSGLDKMVLDIIDQALAPQECNVQDCEFYQEGHCDCYSDESHYPHCLDNPNCYYKQLHSQQKTFTVEEIEVIVNDFDDTDKEWFCSKCLDELLSKFEKETK